MLSPQRITVLLFLFCISLPFSINEAPPPQKLEQQGDTEMKCGSCRCGDSCGQQLPLPSPPPPSPPPPLTYLSSQNCDQPPPPPSPPPPSPRYIYVTGEPGSFPYQTQPYNWGSYYNAAQNTDVGLLVLAGLVTMAIWMTSS